MIIEIKKNEELIPIEFEPKIIEEDDQSKKWELISIDEDYPYTIRFREQAFVLKEFESLPDELASMVHEISAWINDFLKEELERAQSGFDDSEDNEAEEPQPYDPHRIKIRSDRWSISHIFELIDKWKQVELSPDFQRGFVWDRKRQSQLIESLMLRIPVPAFYLSEASNGNYQVVDGLQRLTTIRNFLRNEFNLKYLEYLNDQEGLWFENKEKKKGIDHQYWRNILQTQLTINIIEANSPNKVKFDVFRRVNTGGKPLNNQEIRNCLSEESTRKLINELAFSEEFKQATARSVSTSRMQAQELVLRFICFWHERVKKHKDWEYKGNMTEYLDSAIDLLNQKKSESHDEIYRAFEKGMKNSFYLFGQYNFRKYLPEHFQPGVRQQLINKSLFTTWSVVLSKFNIDNVRNAFSPEEFAYGLAEELKKDDEYYNAVSYKTNDKVYIDKAFVKAQGLIDKYKI